MWDVTGADNQFFAIMPTKDLYENGKADEFVIMSSNGKFFTEGSEGPVTGDDATKAYHFRVYPRSKKRRLKASHL